MRISRRTSGGRGEYEISEQTPSGITPKDLIGCRLALMLAKNFVIDSATELRHAQGKFRIRMLPECEMHLHRQLVAALLMPESVRADAALGAGSPVLLKSRYAIEHINISDATREGKQAVLHVSDVVLRNQSHLAEELDLQQRLIQLRYLWEHCAGLPDSILHLVQEHAEILRTKGPIPAKAENLITQLQARLSDEATDLGILYSEHSDILPALVNLLQLEIPEPILRVDEIHPEEVELKERTIKEWSRWAASRGAASARFRTKVRLAYNSTCLVCGSHFPPTSFARIPGVDAAHILPWSDYDLDRTDNGLCLCKLHHWAFDQGIIDIFHREGCYFVEIPPSVRVQIMEKNTDFSIDVLEEVVGPIPDNRLPVSAKDHPNPELLRLLRQARLR